MYTCTGSLYLSVAMSLFSQTKITRQHQIRQQMKTELIRMVSWKIFGSWNL